jgi:peptide deformylase
LLEVPVKIAQLGQPVLWEVAHPVPPEEIATPEFQGFLREMAETLAREKGVGLAAPQVFAGRRVFLACVEIPVEEGAPLVLEAFINPSIVATSEETEARWEGCLSFPELQVLVTRPVRAEVEYLDAGGHHRRRSLEGFPARVVQHEYDHLEGILTIDRARSPRDIVKTSELETVIRHREGGGE